MTKKRPARGNFRILLVDANRDFLRYLEKVLVEEGISSECIFTAESAGEAKRRFEKVKPMAVVLGYMLPDANGVELGVEFFKKSPKLTIVILTAAILPPEEESLCEEFNFPVLRKHDSSVADLLAVIRADAQSRFEGNYLAADGAVLRPPPCSRTRLAAAFIRNSRSNSRSSQR